MKDLSISIKLSLVIGLVLLLAIAVTTITSTLSNNKIAVEKAENEMQLTLKNSVGEIESIINGQLKELQTHWRDLNSIKNDPGFIRTSTHDFYRTILSEEKSTIGYTVTVVPGKFDGKANQYEGYPGYMADGRYNEYWYKEEGQVIRDEETMPFEQSLEEYGADWWRIPEKLKSNLVYMDLYNVGGKDVLMLSVSYSILEQGDFIGVICKDFISEFIQEEAVLAQSKLFDGRCKIAIYDNDGNIVADTENEENIGKEIQKVDEENYSAILASIQKGSEESFHDGNMYYTMVPIAFSGTTGKWQMRVEVLGSVIKENAIASMWKQLGVSLLAIILSIVVLFLLTKYMLNPLSELSKFSKYIASGDLTHNIEIKSNDEIGVVALAFNKMAEKLRNTVALIVSNTSNIAQGSKQISETSQQLSQGASEQASSVEEVSSTMEQIASNIQQNTDNAQQTEKISSVAQTGIQEVSQQSSDTVDANKQIFDKISIVQDIAFQTNILALNAAVEAARAGEHGKGFAVVAAEVRKLAERSKIAADEIVALANNSLGMAEAAGKKMEELLPEVVKTAQLVQEISSASIEQNNGATQVNSAIQQLNSVTQQNAAASEELATSAEEMNRQAEQLKELTAFFKVGSETTNDFTQTTSKVSAAPIEFKKQSTSNTEVSTKSVNLNMNVNDNSDNEFESF